MRYRIDVFNSVKTVHTHRKTKAGALDYARKQFSRKSVHKVEVWDLETLAVSEEDSFYGPVLIKVHKIST